MDAVFVPDPKLTVPGTNARPPDDLVEVQDHSFGSILPEFGHFAAKTVILTWGRLPAAVVCVGARHLVAPSVAPWGRSSDVAGRATCPSQSPHVRGSTRRSVPDPPIGPSRRERRVPSVAAR
jgi:hypothetical protein